MGSAVTSVRRGVRAVVVLALLPALLALPAAAHEGHDHGADDSAGDGGAAAEEHAALDLAGVPVTEVERRTRAARQRLVAAGRRPALEQRPVAVGDRARLGTWEPFVDTPVVPVSQAVLPDGTVLIWDSVGTKPTETYEDQTWTRAAVYDPRTERSERVDLRGANIFCAGHTQLPDGDVLVAGGNRNAALEGIHSTHVFDWQTRTWSRGPDMRADRWYPSVVTTSTGASLIVAGGPARAELLEPDGDLRTLDGFWSYAQRFYPFLVPRLDGRVGMVGPSPRLDVMSTSGRGALEVAGRRDGLDRFYGSFATYRPGRTLVSGGGPVERAPTRSAVVVRERAGGRTTVEATGPMGFRRKQHQLTVLADGSVLATGGQRTSAYGGLVDPVNPVLAAERWDPRTGRWTTLASAEKARQDHSTASLLPDGRVLTGGGGVCAPCVTAGYLEKNVEVFTPPYLYRRDGSGRLASRPEVELRRGAVRVGTRFTVTSPPSDGVTRLGLVRLGAPTHSVDQGQRYVPLSFRRSRGGPGTLVVRAPASTAVAPPGHYMLFGVDGRGVPSVADVVRVDPRGGTPGRPVDLARGRPASASSEEGPDLTAGRANDGQLATRWASAFSDDQWWQVDLGAPRAVEAVRTAWETAYAARYAIRTSLDGLTWSTARTVRADSAGTRLTSFPVRRARFVRVQGLERGTPWGYSLREVAVLGE